MNLSNITHCPRCRKPLVAAKAIGGGESTSFKECPACGTLINTYRPTNYQAAFLRSRHRYKLCAGGYGCTAPGTPILMYDKTIKLVENIVVGDLVMGVDSTPRLVLELHHGEDAMYHLHTNNGTVTVNLHHIMHIQVGRNRINIPLIEYLMWPSWKRKRAV